jgi:phosphocarrier protein
LHARASAKLTQVANQFESDIWIEKNDKTVNAKSIMGIMMLAASQGTDIKISTEGVDEKEALDSISALINDYFGEGE